MSRAIGITIALIFILVTGFLKLGGFLPEETGHQKEKSIIPSTIDEINYLPEGSDSKATVHHTYYSINYNDEFETPNWVAYKLTEESLKAKNVKRAKRFNRDNKVPGISASHSDYSHSGYTRGHMAPAGDMAFNERAMNESFFMSNMCPQIRTFNNGIWRELEENVRDWAYDNDEIYVVSGPIFNGNNPERIGKNRVAVPDAFFKAILDVEGSKKKGIGFVIPHDKSDKHLRNYAVTLDEIEQISGLDLYADLLADQTLEDQLESKMDVDKWQFDRKRFDQRVKHWNNQK